MGVTGEINYARVLIENGIEMGFTGKNAAVNSAPRMRMLKNKHGFAVLFLFGFGESIVKPF